MQGLRSMVGPGRQRAEQQPAGEPDVRPVGELLLDAVDVLRLAGIAGGTIGNLVLAGERDRLVTEDGDPLVTEDGDQLVLEDA